MKWSFRIGRLAGIDVYVHATFFLLLAYVVFAVYSRGGNWRLAIEELAFVIILFGIVVLHELGHALAARRYGIPTHDITLLPIGGIARLERMPEDPRQELVVALAGPAVNVVLAAICWAWLAATGGVTIGSLEGALRLPLVERLLFINVILVVFNMLPAFPMDGGRVLRALLAMRLDYGRATQIAALIGQGMAVIFFLGGLLLSHPFLALIGIFVWFGAGQEGSAAQIRWALDGVPVSRAMATDFHTLSPRDPLARAVAYVLGGFQEDYPVVEDDGRLVGVLTRPNLLTALTQSGENTLVADAMERNFEIAHPREMLPVAFARLQTCDCHSLPVVRDGEVVGMLTMDNLGEFLSIQAALKSRQTAGSRGVRAGERSRAQGSRFNAE